jgi:hypothetical protein
VTVSDGEVASIAVNSSRVGDWDESTLVIVVSAMIDFS